MLLLTTHPSLTSATNSFLPQSWSNNYAPRALLDTSKTCSSIGFDIMIPKFITLQLNTTTVIPTGFFCDIAKGLSLCIQCHSSLALHQLSIEGVVINNDSCSEIKVVVYNDFLFPSTSTNMHLLQTISLNILAIELFFSALPCPPPARHHSFGATHAK